MSEDPRRTPHYMMYKIAADTDLNNGNRYDVITLLDKLEDREDYIACLALHDAIVEFAKRKRL